MIRGVGPRRFRRPRSVFLRDRAGNVLHPFWRNAERGDQDRIARLMTTHLEHIETQLDLSVDGKTVISLLDLVLVIAKPLQAEENSLNRLLDKIELYLGPIRSKDFAGAAGGPGPGNTAVVVHIHPDSCREAFLLLEKSKEWVQANGAALRVILVENVEDGLEGDD